MKHRYQRRPQKNWRFPLSFNLSVLCG